jgi:uncharacterized protein YcfJ
MRQSTFAGLVFAAGIAAASPALAHDGHQGDGPPPPPEGYGHEQWRGGNEGHWGDGNGEGQREAWLTECRRRVGGRGGATGAVLGGVVGGIAGHEIAGRHDKTLGTVAGAAVGAVAGAAIERSARRPSDYCESMLQPQGGYYHGYPAQGYGYAYAMPVMMVPMMMVPAPAAPKKDCKEVVTTEYVTTYDTVYRKVREVRYRSVPTYKRVRVVPDKRLRMETGKRVLGS